MLKTKKLNLLKLSEMNVETKVIKSKLGLLNLAEELGNVSLACKYLGYNRNPFSIDKDVKRSGKAVLSG